MSETEVLDAPAAITEFNAIEKGLAELRGELAGVQFDVTTVAGDKAARAARSRCVSIRTSADAAYEGWNKPMLSKQREMRAVLATIKDGVKAVEEPIDAQIKAEEQRKAAIKAEKDRIELERQQAIQARIYSIGQYPVQAAGQCAAEIANLRITVSELPITTELYEHRAGEAMALQSDTINKLTQMHAAALAQEQEAVRLAEERAALEIKRQEQEAEAQRQREADAEKLAEERKALEAEQKRLKADRDAEDARQVAAKAEQDRKDAAAAAEIKRQQDEVAEAQRAQQAEIDRQRRELEAQQEATRVAEQKKADDAARVLREQAEAERAAAAEKERAAAAESARREKANFIETGPGDVLIVTTLADFFDVPNEAVLAWLAKFDPKNVA